MDVHVATPVENLVREAGDFEPLPLDVEADEDDVRQPHLRHGLLDTHGGYKRSGISDSGVCVS